MRARQLIRELEKAVEQFGNLRVEVRDSGNGCSYEGISVLPDPASILEEERGEEGKISLSVYSV